MNAALLLVLIALAAALLLRRPDTGRMDELRERQGQILQRLHDTAQHQQLQLSAMEARLQSASSADAERADRLRQQVDARLLSNEERVERMRLTVLQQLTSLQESNAKKLDEMRQTVDKQLQETLEKRLSESFRTVSERLEQVHKGLGEMQQLAQGVGDLRRVMTGVKTRGVWGEVQLGALLEDMLTPDQYERNVAVAPGARERVEFAVRLPGADEGAVLLPIDAKFPLEDYQRLLDAQEAGERALVEEAGQKLESALRLQAKNIQKYIAPPATTNFAYMYLPTEGLYAEALRRPGLQAALQRDYQVLIAGPSTLCSMLSALQMGFRTLAIQRRSGEVWKLLGAVKAEFGKYADLLEKSLRQIDTARGTLDDAAKKTRTIENRLSEVQALPAADGDAQRELPQP